MLAWKLKWRLSGCRLDFNLNMRPVRVRLFVRHKMRLRARPLSRGGFCIARNRTVASLACNTNCPPLALTDWISKQACGLYVTAYWYAIQCAYARCGFCIARNRTAAMSAWKLRWALSDCWLGFIINTRPVRARLLVRHAMRLRARTLSLSIARCILYCPQ